VANSIHNLLCNILCVQLYILGIRLGRVAALGCRGLSSGSAARAGKTSRHANGIIWLYLVYSDFKQMWHAQVLF